MSTASGSTHSGEWTAQPCIMLHAICRKPLCPFFTVHLHGGPDRCRKWRDSKLKEDPTWTLQKEMSRKKEELAKRKGLPAPPQVSPDRPASCAALLGLVQANTALPWDVAQSDAPLLPSSCPHPAPALLHSQPAGGDHRRRWLCGRGSSYHCGLKMQCGARRQAGRSQVRAHFCFSPSCHEGRASGAGHTRRTFAARQI